MTPAQPPDDPPRRPPRRAKVLEFPSSSRLQARGEDEEDSSAEVKAAWEAELPALRAEEPGRRCRLVLKKPDGLALIEFLAPTGLEALVLIEETKTHLIVTSDRETITRLVVWHSLDLGLDFSVDFLD